MTAKDSWSQQRQIGRAQDGALAGALLGQLHNGRTMAWDADLESKVRALTPEQIRAAMQKYLDPAKMAYMRGGDFANKAKGE
jgi:zinc protease